MTHLVVFTYIIAVSLIQPSGPSIAVSKYRIIASREQAPALAATGVKGIPSSYQNVSCEHFGKHRPGLPEEIRMGAGANENKIVAFDLVEKQPVRLDVAIAVSAKIARQGMIL